MSRDTIKDNNNQPVNTCGHLIFYWLVGNTSMAETSLNKNFDIVEDNPYCCNKLLTYSHWRINIEQKKGYTQFAYGSSFDGAGFDESFNVLPDGTTPQYPNGLDKQYIGSKLVPLSKKEMKYVKSKLLVSTNAENVIETRYHDLSYFSCSVKAYYVDTKTNELIYWRLNSWDYSPQEDAYLLPKKYGGVNAIFNKDLRPATKEELSQIIQREQQEDKETVEYAKQHGYDVPKLASKLCAEMRQDYLDGLNNPVMGEE